jgi:sigma-B regulation protein RsbU (phosphoserine phosphatase)
MLLGVIDVATYGRSRIELQSGDLLILFSDGITEARNRTQQMFRQQGVLEAVQGLTSGTAGDVLDRIWSRYESHTGGENNDDRTLMVIRVR